MDYMGIFVEDDSPPVRQILGNDDGLHCSTCRHEERVDFHTCNQCSRAWAATNCLVHVGWKPKIC